MEWKCLALVACKEQEHEPVCWAGLNMDAKKAEKFLYKGTAIRILDKTTEDKELECKGRSVCLRSISEVRNHCEVQQLV